MLLFQSPKHAAIKLLHATNKMLHVAIKLLVFFGIAVSIHACTSQQEQAEMPEQPNIVFFVLDDLNDWINPLGYHQASIVRLPGPPSLPACRPPPRGKRAVGETYALETNLTRTTDICRWKHS